MEHSIDHIGRIPVNHKRMNHVQPGHLVRRHQHLLERIFTNGYDLTEDVWKELCAEFWDIHREIRERFNISNFVLHNMILHALSMNATRMVNY